MTFGSLGYGPQARSVLQCHGILALRWGHCPGAVQMKANRQSQGLELVSSRFRKWRLAVWATGRRPGPSFTATVFWPCDGVFDPELCRMKANRQSQGLELVSSRFRKWRLAVWATGRRPGPSFTATCFGPAMGSLARSCAGWKLTGKVKAWS